MDSRMDRDWMIGAGIMLLVALVVWAWAWDRESHLRAGDLPTDNRVPPYQINDCFVRNGILEPWEPHADGIVIQVGYQHYLVLFSREADRRAWIKHGTSVSKDTLELQYHPTTCPAEWLHHPAGKKPQRKERH